MFSLTKKALSKKYVPNTEETSVMSDAVKSLTAHVDMDAFFASVEQLDDPSLKGTPVIVGADPSLGRGVVSAASYEARKFGIHSAMPISEAFRRCPAARFIKPRLSRYSEISHEIMLILGEFSPLVEQISVDEAFLDLTGSEKLFGSPEDTGKLIKQTIKSRTGLTASVGIAPVMHLAKICSDFEKPDGLTVIRPHEVKEFLKNLDIGKIWGVGPKCRFALVRAGIHTAGDYLQTDPEKTAAILGRATASHILKLASGEDPRKVNPDKAPVKSISHDKTFLKDTSDKKFLVNTLFFLSEKVGVRIREKGLSGRTVSITIRDNLFRNIVRSETLPRSLSSTKDIYETALKLFNANYEGKKIRLLSVKVSGFQNNSMQIDLFDSYDERKEIKNRPEDIDFLMDSVNRKFGKGKIKRGRLL
ncbi:MAG: DNA polymerase IV [Fibrobacterota bacterium]